MTTDRCICGRPAHHAEFCPGDPVDYEAECCETCGAELEREDCWQCSGDGGFHDCGEDVCCCLEPDGDLNDRCDVCGGKGNYLECPFLPHEAAEGAPKP